MSGSDHPLRVVLETGNRKAFASAIDWPGWSRSGKDAPSSIDALLSYRDRYGEVIRLAGLEPLAGGALATSVVHEADGGSMIDFGVIGPAAAVDQGTFTEVEAARLLALMRAAWTIFDGVASEVSPELRRGPRGGGRDRDAIIEHVLEAERAYARKIGVRNPRMAIDDTEAIEAHRSAILDMLRELAAAADIPEHGWPPRYAIRRMAWHVLDHAWEMQDKDLNREAGS